MSGFSVKNTQYGVTWGNVVVERMCSNDGKDGRKIWYALVIKGPKGGVELAIDRNGCLISQRAFECTRTKKVSE